MVVNKRKKNSRQRGSMSHGWGAKKKHRGSGNRGGKGMAGTGKRADSKKPSINTSPGKDGYFGKRGFKMKGNLVVYIPIGIENVCSKVDFWLKEKKITKEKDVYIVNLEDFGFNKILSNGICTKKLRITVPFASKKAAEKIKSAGGELITAEVTAEVKKVDKKAEPKTAKATE